MILKSGKEIILDSRWEEMFKYCNISLNGSGYARVGIRLKNKQISEMVHRTIMDAPRGSFVDHINGNKLDNRASNLRICTKSQNGMNKGVDSDFKLMGSIFKGVTYSKRPLNKKWRANIKVNQKQINIGYFLTEIEAAAAYNDAAKKYHKEFAYLNVIKNS